MKHLLVLSRAAVAAACSSSTSAQSDRAPNAPAAASTTQPLITDFERQ